MAMPIDYNNLRVDEATERTDDVHEYRKTCIDFIENISQDYKDWVERYKLDKQEDKRRREEIDAVISRTSQWIAKVAQSIKGVDVVMNDGIQKMAEATAGRPLEIGVFVNKMAGYVEARPGIIDINVKAAGRENRKMKLGFHFGDKRFRIESTCDVHIDETNLPEQKFEMMDIHLKLYAQNAKSRDVISFTIIVSEVSSGDDGVEFDRRGITTIAHIV